MLSIRILLVGLVTGVVFAILDGLMNANPLAQRLYSVYAPITRASVNAPLGMAFDLVSGIVMAWLFVLLAAALPGSPLEKGAMFGLIAWFFRVAMGAASQAVMFTVPALALLYSLTAGLLEMVILGMLYGLTLGRR